MKTESTIFLVLKVKYLQGLVCFFILFCFLPEQLLGQKTLQLSASYDTAITGQNDESLLIKNRPDSAVIYFDLSYNKDKIVITIDNKKSFFGIMTTDKANGYAGKITIPKTKKMDLLITIKNNISYKIKFDKKFCAVHLNCFRDNISWTYTNKEHVYLPKEKPVIPNDSGKIFCRIALPFFDLFGFNNGRSFSSYGTLLGFTGAIDYYYAKNSYISFSGGATGIASVTTQTVTTLYNDTNIYYWAFSAKLTNNHDFYFPAHPKLKVSLGYGLNYSNFTYYQTVQATPTSNEITIYSRIKSTIGFCGDAYLYYSKHWYAGISLLPSFLTLNSPKMELSYLTFIDFGFRFTIKKSGKNKKKVATPTPRF